MNQCITNAVFYLKMEQVYIITPMLYTNNVISKCGCLQISWWVYVNSSSHQSIAIPASGKSHCFWHYQYHSKCWGYILWLSGENIPFSCYIVSYYSTTDVIEFVSKLFATFRLDQWPTMYIMFGWLYVSTLITNLLILELVNNIPTMPFLTGISRNTQSKSYTLSLTEYVWEFRDNALWDTH